MFYVQYTLDKETLDEATVPQNGANFIGVMEICITYYFIRITGIFVNQNWSSECDT